MLKVVNKNNVSQLKSQIERYLSGNVLFYEKVKEISIYNDFCLIGGSIRDILGGMRPRDFDFIVNIERNELYESFKDFTISKNRFGGIKCIVDNFEVDMWTFKDNWAFKAGIIGDEAKDLQYGALFGVDSITFNLRTSEIFNNIYNNSARTRKLSFVNYDSVARNPMPDYNVLKAIVLKCKYDLEFDDYVSKFICNRVINEEREYYDILRDIQILHYGEIILKYSEYIEVIKLALGNTSR